MKNIFHDEPLNATLFEIRAMLRTGTFQTLQRHPCEKHVADSLDHGYFGHRELRTTKLLFGGHSSISLQ